MTDGLSDNNQTEKDVSYAPSSERETEEKQRDQTVPSDVDADAVKALPGTGGPDDGGDIEVDPADIHIPGRAEG
jgi:hypothetical protein